MRTAVAFSNSEIRLIDTVSFYVERLIALQKNPSLSRTPLRPANLSFPFAEYFIGQEVPSITVRDYVKRAVAHVHCSPECFVFAITYLRRVVDKGFPFNLKTVHRLFITALTVAVKSRDDFFFTMSHYGKIGGLSTKDLCEMELRFFVNILDCRADVSVEEYSLTCQEMADALGPPPPPGNGVLSRVPSISECGMSTSSSPFDRSTASRSSLLGRENVFSTQQLMKECVIFFPKN